MAKNMTPPTALAVPDMEALVLPSGVEILDDNAQYTNRFDFASSSGNVYRVAQSKKGRWWACSCPSWLHKAQGNRHCKHLRDFGLPPDYEAFEVGRLELAPAGTPSAMIGAVPMPFSKKGKAALAAVPGGKPMAPIMSAPLFAALPAASAALPACKPKTVEMKGSEIVVTFDVKDSAAVFALLAQLSGSKG
jgi:hypothetical protein